MLVWGFEQVKVSLLWESFPLFMVIVLQIKKLLDFAISAQKESSLLSA